MKAINIITFCLLIFVFAGCNSKSPVSFANFSDEDINEAKTMATWYSGELLPSDQETEKALRRLNRIRSQFGNQYGVVNMRFLAPWQLGTVSLLISDEAFSILEETGVHPWDNWDFEFQPEQQRQYPINQKRFHLTFAKDYNPHRLCEMLSSKPEIIQCEANSLIFSGFAMYPIIIIPLSENEIEYWFTGGISVRTQTLRVKQMNNVFRAEYISTETSSGFPDLPVFTNWKTQ
jgi:hypothetical protein